MVSSFGGGFHGCINPESSACVRGAHTVPVRRVRRVQAGGGFYACGEASVSRDRVWVAGLGRPAGANAESG